MDLSKLPKLSQTTTPRNDGGVQPPAAEYSSPRRPDYQDEGPLNFLDIFLAIGMGLLFMLLGMDYGKHLMGSKEAFPEVTGTGYVWREGHPKAGQEILPEELTPENKAAYEGRIQARTNSIVGQSSLFLIGAALLLAGVLGVVGHLGFLPLRVQQAGAALSVLATTAGMLYGIYAVVTLMAADILPAMTFVAILVAGLSLFMQAAVLRSLVGGPSPAAYDRPVIDPVARPSPTQVAQSAERLVHHRFAHQVLRRQVFEDPAKVVGTLQGPGGPTYLREMWEATCHAAGARPELVPPTGLESEMTQVGPYSAAIVTMPPARDRGEAHFVGIVLRSYVRQDGAVIERSPLVLYYALETEGPGSGKAVLCEWQAGDHVRFADAVAVDFSAFREAMRQKVDQRQQAEDRLSGAAV